MVTMSPIDRPHHAMVKPASKFICRLATIVIAPRAAMPCETEMRYRPPVRPAARKSATERMYFFVTRTPVRSPMKTAPRISQSQSDSTARRAGGS